MVKVTSAARPSRLSAAKRVSMRVVIGICILPWESLSRSAIKAEIESLAERSCVRPRASYAATVGHFDGRRASDRRSESMVRENYSRSRMSLIELPEIAPAEQARLAGNR